MTLPFTREQFFDAFTAYNEAVWPMQLALYALALAALALAFSRGRHSGRVISVVLALLWAWMGVVYHLGFFRPVNPAAVVFGALFLAGAAVFAWEGGVRGRLRFQARSSLGYLLLGYALVAYPFLAVLFGHVYPATPTFGLPCPTTIFTIGMLALLRAPYPRHVFVVPVLWALIGLQAVFFLGVHEDLGLLAAAAAGAWLALQGRRTYEQPLVS